MPDCSTCRGNCTVPEACSERTVLRYDRANPIEGPYRRPRLPRWAHAMAVATVILLLAYAQRKGWWLS